MACLSPYLAFKPYLAYKKFVSIHCHIVEACPQETEVEKQFSFFIPKVPCFSVADIFRHSSKYCYGFLFPFGALQGVRDARVKLPRDISKSQQGVLAFKGITTLFPLLDRSILSISVSTGEMEMNKQKMEGTR